MRGEKQSSAHRGWKWLASPCAEGSMRFSHPRGFSQLQASVGATLHIFQQPPRFSSASGKLNCETSHVTAFRLKFDGHEKALELCVGSLRSFCSGDVNRTHRAYGSVVSVNANFKLLASNLLLCTSWVLWHLQEALRGRSQPHLASFWRKVKLQHHVKSEKLNGGNEWQLLFFRFSLEFVPPGGSRTSAQSVHFQANVSLKSCCLSVWSLTGHLGTRLLVLCRAPFLLAPVVTVSSPSVCWRFLYLMPWLFPILSVKKVSVRMLSSSFHLKQSN